MKKKHEVCHVMIQVRPSFHVTRSFTYASTIKIDQTAIFGVCSLLLVSIIHCTQSMPDGTAGVFRRLPDRPWETLSGRIGGRGVRHLASGTEASGVRTQGAHDPNM